MSWQKGSLENRSSPRIITLCFAKSALRSIHRLAALSSQSCFSAPSCGVINSGSRQITLGLFGVTITGVKTLWSKLFYHFCVG